MGPPQEACDAIEGLTPAGSQEAGSSSQVHLQVGDEGGDVVDISALPEAEIAESVSMNTPPPYRGGSRYLQKAHIVDDSGYLTSIADERNVHHATQ